MEERFNAKIIADVSDFLKKMKEVDKKIRDFALEAQKPISLDSQEFTADMQRAKMETERFVQEASKPIDADFDDFYQALATGEGATAEFLRESSKPIKADLNDFYTDLVEAEVKAKEFVRNATKPIDVDISAYLWGLRVAEAETRRTLTRSEKTIGADISEFMRKAALVSEKARTLARDKVIVRITALNSGFLKSIETFQNRINRLATNIRAFGDLAANTFSGLGTALSPALVPLVATLGGLVGQLGPMVGTLAGSTFALATAFGAAGLAAGAFTSVAVSNLKEVFGASSDIKDLQEKLAASGSDKERAKILAEIARVQGSLNAEQTKAYESMQKLSATWQGLASSFEKPTIQIFTQFMDILGNTLERVRPLFEGSVKAVENLTTSLSNAMKGENVSTFIDYLNAQGGPMLETMGKAFGNFTSGILGMFSAFGPLATNTANGFLEMSERFSEWASGLSESAKFQSFVDYVNTNMPKLRSIFGDAFEGIINVFSAFGPSSSDMMSSLEDMMGKFKEWSSTLAENQSFQNFINYIKENGPTVVSSIGGMITSLVNIGVALAPVGAKLLELVDGFLQWTNKMMEAHPILGQVGAAVLVMSGLLVAFAPNLIAFGALFGPVFGKIMSATSLMRAKFVTGMTMMVTSMVKTAASMAVQAGKFIAHWVKIGVQSLIHAGKVAAAWVVATGKAMAKALASMAVAAAKFIAHWVKMGVQAMLQAGRMAAAWFIALGPVGWVIAAVVALAILIIANWDKIKAATVKIWKSVSEAVKDAWNKVVDMTSKAVTKVMDYIKQMPGKIAAFKSKMIAVGKQLIEGLISGITDMGKKALQKVKDLGDSIISAAKGVFDINSPSRVFKTIGGFIGEGLSNGISASQRANEKAMHSLGKGLTSIAERDLKELGSLFSNASHDLAFASVPVPNRFTSGNYRPDHAVEGVRRQIQDELKLELDMNHHSNGSPAQVINNYNNNDIKIDPKNVKDFNDVIRLVSVQQRNRHGGK